MNQPGTQLSLFESRPSKEAFVVRVSARARRLTARVHVGGRVEIVVPKGVGPTMVRDFVQRSSGWIERTVAAMRSSAPVEEPVPREIRFDFCAERFAVEWRPGPARTPREHGARLIVGAPDAGTARRLLRRWLKRAALARLAPALLALAAERRVEVARVVARCQRTRWGSCSTRGTISLNASLLFLREPVVRYLFAHELAHLQHMNHSRRFWRLVESLEPDYRRLDRELLGGWRSVPAWVHEG